MSNISTPPLSRALLYKKMLKQTYQLLRDDNERYQERTDNKPLTVIFKALKDSDDNQQ